MRKLQWIFTFVSVNLMLTAYSQTPDCADFMTTGNDIVCTAIDLGTLQPNGRVGDASLGSFNNFCGTKSPDELDPIAQGAPWVNNIGVWYSFQTGDHLSTQLVIEGRSDPEETGDGLKLQIGVYESSDNTCTGRMRLVGRSGSSSRDTDLDETIVLECRARFKPNTTYFIIVDGVVDNPDDLTGNFGLEVRDRANGLREVDTTLCFGERLQYFYIFHTEAGRYQDTIRLFDGCDTVIWTNLTILDELELTVMQTDTAYGVDVANGGATVSAIGGAGNFSFEWSDGSRARERNDLIGGQNYEVTVTDANNCTQVANLFVTHYFPIQAQVLGDSLACFGDQDGILTISASSGLPPYRYRLRHLESDFEENGTITEADEILQFDSLSAGTYELIIEDESDQRLTVNGMIFQPDALALNIAEQLNVSCFGFCDAQLNLLAEGGTSPYTYQWSAGSSMSDQAMNLCAGTVDIQLIDAQNCFTELTTTIEEPEEFVVTAIVDNVACLDGADGSIALESNGSPQSYIWNTGATTAGLDNLDAGNYQVTVTNANDCIDELSIEIEEPNEAIGLDLSLVQPIRCHDTANGILLAQGRGDGTTFRYTWSTTAATTPQVENLGAGLHQVTVTNENGCTTTDSMRLEAPLPLSFSTTQEDIGCLDDALSGIITFENVQGGTPPYHYSIDGVRFDNNPMLTQVAEGPYTVVVQDMRACEAEQAVLILGPPEVSVNLGQDRVLKLGETLELRALTNASNVRFDWTNLPDSIVCNNCTSVRFQPTGSTFYTVQITDTLTDCTATATVMISVSKERAIYAPTAFSPNNDSFNDFFTIYAGADVRKINKFQIFARTGQLLYEVNNILPNAEQLGWNGDFKDSPMPEGIFVYLAEIEFIDNQVLRFEGDVTLMR